MLVIDLETFKTKKCEVVHSEKPLSALRLDCPHYHSREDKRRNPFANNRTLLIYSDVYVEDYYSTQMASNLVEYLFHPNIYKTELCKDRMRYAFEHGKNTEDCRQNCCPYIH